MLYAQRQTTPNRDFDQNEYAVSRPDRLNFQALQTSGTNDSEDENITVYPNPTQGIVIVNNNTLHDDLSLEIRNMEGLVVDIQHRIQKGQHSITLAALTDGIYTMKFFTKNDSFIKVQKLILVNK